MTGKNYMFFKAVNGSAITIYGCIHANVVYDNKIYVHEFYVADIEVNLLGIDFLCKHDLVLLPRENVLIEKATLLPFGLSPC